MPLHFSTFYLLDPEIPSNDLLAHVSLQSAPSDAGVVSIKNLTRGEYRGVFAVLDPVVRRMRPPFDREEAKYQGTTTTRTVYLEVELAEYDGEAKIGVWGGRYIDEDDFGRAGYNFRLEQITLADWAKLKAIVEA